MDQIAPSDLKTILHSKRTNIYYLEHCRVLVNGGRVEYVTDAGRERLYWNIPIANTTTVLLGPGTSVTQAAMRELGKAGVMVAFCGGGGTPLFTATEPPLEALWFSPQSEYRPTVYLQQWVGFWFDDQARLEAAKAFQMSRLQFTARVWMRDRDLAGAGFASPGLEDLLDKAAQRMLAAPDVTALLTEEARLTKALYRLAAEAVSWGEFTRAAHGGGTDAANRFLDHGNYLAYGLGATAAWVLGIPHGLAVMHGKTRRGGLVFDAADLIKDALVLPVAFLSAAKGLMEREFRLACVEMFARHEALDFIIETIKTVAGQMERRPPSSAEDNAGPRP